MKKNVLQPSLLIATIIFTAALFLSNTEQAGSYKPRKSSKIKIYSFAEEAMKHRMSLISDLNGDFDINRYMQLRDQALLMDEGSRVVNLSWIEEGPDNVGGRVRAIAIYKNNPNIVFVGSVSGGLFKSTDGGNTWQTLNAFNQNLAVSSICITGNGRVYVSTGLISATSSTIYTQGIFRESFVGDGIFYSDDLGDTWQELTVTQLASNPPITKLEADPINPDKIWISGQGANIKLSTYDPVNGWNTLNFQSNNTICDFKISKDGQVIICGAGIASSVTTYVSTDGGQNFTNVSGTVAQNKIPSAGHYRGVFAISHEKNSNGFWNLYAVFGRTNNISFNGAYVSEDHGNTWYQIAPGGSAAFNPTGSQADYDIICHVAKGNPGRLFVAGLDVYEWNRASGAIPTGQWQQISQWFLPEFLPGYVHADQHEMRYDDNGNFYIGSDGGISRRFPAFGNIFNTSNKGLNCTQFYSIACNAWGDVIGGAQDNGTQINNHQMASYQSFFEGIGGDGFDCDMSNISRELMFGSLYFGDAQRSINGGSSFSSFFDTLTPNSSFYTRLKYWETTNDPNSLDSVLFINSIKQQLIGTGNGVKKKFTGNINQYLGPNKQIIPGTVEIILGITPALTDNGMGQFTGALIDNDSANFINYTNGQFEFHLTTAPANNLPVKANHYIRYNPGAVIDYASQSFNGYPLTHTVTSVINANDTIKLVDPVQTWFALSLTGTTTPAPVINRPGIWMTRYAARPNATAKWFRVPDHPGTGTLPGGANAFAYSKDGNYLFIAYTGKLVRVSGLNTVYAPNYDLTNLQVDDIFFSPGGSIEGVCIDFNNPDRVIVTLAQTGTGAKIYRTTQATSAAHITSGIGTFSSMQGNLPQMPTYDAIINVYDQNVVVVGTEFGVYATDNAWAPSPSWTYQGSGNSPGRVPVTTVKQQQWTDPYVVNKGAIYIGTYGRGVFRSDTYLSTNTNSPQAISTAVNNLLVYPNPMNDVGTLVLDLVENANVQVRIIDLRGRLVQNMNLGQMQQGRQQIALNVNDLSTGTYIINVLIGKEMKNTRLVVNK